MVQVEERHYSSSMAQTKAPRRSIYFTGQQSTRVAFRKQQRINNAWSRSEDNSLAKSKPSWET